LITLINTFNDDITMLRWDNKEHFPTISMHPHCFHNLDGEVVDSPLTGDVQTDLLKVVELMKNIG